MRWRPLADNQTNLLAKECRAQATEENPGLFSGYNISVKNNHGQFFP
jgi:hypothetical protein